MLTRRLLVYLLLASTVVLGCSDRQRGDRPNILLIVLDDFGYHDLGANGNPATPTAHLDSLARQGVRYTRHYADSTCTAARVALLTGRSPVTFGFRPTHLRLSDEVPTLPKALRAAGYHTEHIGKWHVGNSARKDAPNRAGFDNWFGFLTQFNLQGFSDDGLVFKRPGYHNPWLEGNAEPAKQYPGHLTDILTDRALDFLDQRNPASTPWLLNLWYYAPHNPIQPALRFQQQYPDTDEGRYHALIAQLDHNVGRILRKLEQQGLSDNTLVIVLSDNGGTNQRTNNNRPFYGRKGQFYEGGVRTPMLMRWPGKIAANSVRSAPVSIYDIFPTVAGAALAPVPDQITGTDLLARQPPPTLPLFWEYSTSEYHNYAVLSGDGRWRLIHDFAQAPVLNDLELDSTGTSNVVQAHPEIVQQLRQQYFDWRRQARVVSSHYRTDIAGGGALLEGNDMQRSPGYGGFTFAIGVTPAAAVAHNTQAGVIAEQEQRWRLEYAQDRGIQLAMMGTSLQGPALTAGTCSDIVVSSHYMFSPLNEKANRSIVQLYINKQLIETITEKQPRRYSMGYEHPTYLGRGADGKQAFNGSFSRPILLNERLVPDAQAAKIGNGISDLPSLCPPQPGTLP